MRAQLVSSLLAAFAASAAVMGAASAQLVNPSAPAAVDHVISGTSLCGAASDSTCALIEGSGSMTLYPKDKVGEKWFQLSFKINAVGLRAAKPEDDSDDADDVDSATFSDTKCSEQSTKQVVFDYLTQYVCRDKATTGNGHTMYLARVLSVFTEEKTVEWGNETVTIPANSLKDTWVVSMDSAAVAQIQNGSVKLHWEAGWNVPTTLPEIMDAGMAIDDLSKVSLKGFYSTVKNEAGSVTQVSTDAIFSLSMTVPQQVGSTTCADCSVLNGVQTPGTFVSLTNDAAPGKSSADLQGIKVPTNAIGSTAWPVTADNQYAIDPIFEIKPGILAKGSLKLTTVVYGGAGVVVVFLICCCCCCYRCCCRSKKPKKQKNQELSAVPGSVTDV